MLLAMKQLAQLLGVAKGWVVLSNSSAQFTPKVFSSVEIRQRRVPDPSAHESTWHGDDKRAERNVGGQQSVLDEQLDDVHAAQRHAGGSQRSTG